MKLLVYEMDTVSDTDTSAHALSVSSWTVQIWPIIAGLLLLIYVWERSIDYVRRRELPPGPRGWPVIGNLLLLDGEKPHRTLMQLAREYGPLLFLKLGSSPTVVVSSPELAEEFLKTQDHIFASRPPSLLGEIFFYNHQDILTAPLGPKWRGMRKLCATELFSATRLATFYDSRKSTILEASQQILREGREGKPVDLSKKTAETTFNLTTRMLFGKSYYNQKTKGFDSHGNLRELRELIEEFSVVAGLFCISDFIPWLRVLDIGARKATFLNLRGEFDAFISQVLDEHRDRDSRDVTATRDITDVVLEIQKNGTTTGDFSEEAVKSFLTILLLGGTDTTAGSMVWMLSEILRHPDIKQRLLEELDNVVGRERLVEESDLDNLPYFQATLRESFRLHPIGPLFTPHYSTEATIVAGYTIPKNTRVIINEYAICRSPEVWENPTEFDPTRFLNNMVDLKGSDFRILPFGSGRRVCPAANLGIKMVSLNVAQILHTSDISLPQGMKPEDIDMGETFGMSMHRTQPLEVQVSPRLSHHVYSAAGIDF